MPLIQLDESVQKQLKRRVKDQVDARSAHLTEALAAAQGFRSNAALRAKLEDEPDAHYVRFDEEAFFLRLEALSPQTPRTTIDVSPLAFKPVGHALRYVPGMLEDPHLTLLEWNPFFVRFRFTGLAQEVTVSILIKGLNLVEFRRSHAIKAPGQLDFYNPSRLHDDDNAYCMHRAVESLASYYRSAVKAGHTPQETWLKPVWA
ncbi:hypothetical protein [Caulobacter sp. RHG1]|uniref:hypothetical protein n=1 Tax=Caulobacter sp. (strain RHG1) TaxID=2545762 RepID=UPI0015518B93|nr:hypothetical protein [Caulobacter sp. RHG1]NQE64294.1 hypothetical protein [Caulobacter sp. RHG1]